MCVCVSVCVRWWWCGGVGGGRIQLKRTAGTKTGRVTRPRLRGGTDTKQRYETEIAIFGYAEPRYQTWVQKDTKPNFGFPSRKCQMSLKSRFFLGERARKHKIFRCAAQKHNPLRCSVVESRISGAGSSERSERENFFL